MKKVLIITLAQGPNYGGMLQAYALQQKISQMGFEVESTYSKGQIHKRLVRSIPGLSWFAAKLRGRNYNPIDKKSMMTYTLKFVARHIVLVDYDVAVLKSLLGKYDFYIVGSDQVWREPYAYVPHNMFSFVLGKAPRISYAASFGRDDISEYSDTLLKKTRRLARKFNAISVRESSGIGICKDQWNVSAQSHVDPTLLLDAANYRQLIDQDDTLVPTTEGETLFTYVLDTSAAKKKIVDVVVRETGLKHSTIIDGYKNAGSALPPVTQWIRGFSNAKYVVTDSFHGTVFAIIFNKPFITIGNKDRGLARFSSLLRMFGLEDRLVFSIDDITSELINKRINWQTVNEKIKSEQKRSFEYLNKCLEKSDKDE